MAMWIIMVLGIVMAGGGLILHRQVEGEPLPLAVDTRLVRYWHNELATPFALILGVMMVSGLLMWMAPKILARQAK